MSYSSDTASEVPRGGFFRFPKRKNQLAGWFFRWLFVTRTQLKNQPSSGAHIIIFIIMPVAFFISVYTSKTLFFVNPVVNFLLVRRTRLRREQKIYYGVNRPVDRSPRAARI